LSASFASIIFGLGIDYGIHLIGRFEELLDTGVSESDALPLAAESVGRGIVTGALTTAGVFLAMLASGFRGFQELGVIAAVGVLISLVTTFTVLPSMLLLGSRRRVATPAPSTPNRVGRALVSLHRPGVAIVLACGIVAAIAA